MISLIIPAYNEEKYLGACLDSIGRCGAGKFSEILVVNNASTDNTAVVAEMYQGEKVRVVSENKRGLTLARQAGYLAAHGDLLAYNDADTQMPTGWYEQVVSEFARDPNLVCLSGPCLYYDIPMWQQGLVWVYWYIFALPIYYIVGYMMTGGNFVIKREVLDRIGGFDTSIDFYGDDTNLARRASRCGKVKFKPGLVMYTSGRRFAQEGLVPTAYKYVLNFLSEIYRQKPVSMAHQDIR